MPRAGEEGFALMEAVVALAILGAAIAMAYAALGQSWRAQRSGERTSEALAIAQNVFAALGSETPLADGQIVSGDERGLAWQVRVERYAAAADSGANAQAPAAYWLTFDAHWAEAGRRAPHNLQLRALRLGASQ